MLAEVGFDEILAVTPPAGRSLAGVDLALSDGDSLFAGLARTIWAPVGAHREAT